MASILIIDDDEAAAGELAGHLGKTAGYTVVRAQGGRDGLALFDRVRPDVVLLDLGLPDAKQLDLLGRAAGGDAVVLGLAEGSAETATALAAMQGGAENVLAKPLDASRLALLVDRAVEKARLRKVSRYLSTRRGATLGAVGASPTMRDLNEQIEMLARSDRTTVLIFGESGSGKARVAEWIHAHSPRAAGPFVELSCAATPAAVLDAQLFGDEREPAAAAGANGEPRLTTATRVGLLEVADGGTLFLDEVGDLPQELQPKLLSVLESRRFRRLHGIDEIATNIRLIAATSKDLVNEVTGGNFREDLYYRLSVMPVYLPPLRARLREDLTELVGSVYAELRPQLPEAPAALPDEVMERLLAYSWPGNIRELRNVLERAMLLARGAPRLVPAHLPAEVRAAAGGAGGARTAGDGGGAGGGAAGERHVPRTLDEVERMHIERTLRAHNGNRTHASRELGISRATLIKKIKQYGLDGAR